ncbi:hypothetical protein [Aeromicrobium sp.]|uniref:sunset domain-containing protein n=1 Tax=Aeromicrobium sp. TaxID=1871063 RepID=UPI0019B9D1DB|nr:hypothetical protein [Aeromicrobium sp.]MBC7633625.1 hypothetical protein [Aeromicrobium sp.]
MFTVGEIIIWLVLASALGFALGWLMREQRFRATSLTAKVPDAVAEPPGSDDEPTSPPQESVPAEEPALAKKAAPKKRAAPKKAPVRTAAPTIAPGAFPRSAAPLPGGEAPSPAHVIKGNVKSMIYHPPGGSSYSRTVAQIWFTGEDDAVAAGFRRSRR